MPIVVYASKKAPAESRGFPKVLSLLAARSNDFRQRENTQQIIIGADFLAADGATSTGAGR